jgi:hypothetical protein
MYYNMEISTEHMKNRCYFIAAMCGVSAYTWYNYSLYDQIDTQFFTPYYQNCLLMLVYLGWDTYHMIINPALFRTDLMIHHSVTAAVFLSYINYVPLEGSNVLIMECISLMNYIWISNPTTLKVYRTFCIIGVRIPLSLWLWVYYTPDIIIPYYKQLDISSIHYYYLSTLSNGWIMYIIYDLFILWKLYKPKKHTE